MPNNNERNNAQSRVVTRNFVAKNQWQRGGVHEKITKAKRQKVKQKLKKQIRAGYYESSSDFLII